MSINSEKNITKRSWDAIPMSYTIIARINKIVCKKKDQFIFTDYRCFPFVDIKITGVDRDDSYSNKIQTPQEPPHHFPEIEESEEEPEIQDPNIDLKINHKKPKEQV